MAGRASMNKDALVAFSPAYGAPEQWAPRRFGQTGRWTDVWGLALTVVEAIKGDEVVVGDHAAMMGTILDPERRPSPRNEGVQISDEAEAVFLRALAVDPVERYQSVGEFWDNLTAVLGIQSDVGRVAIQHVRTRGGRATTGFDSVRPPPPVDSSQQGVGIPPVRAPIASVHEASQDLQSSSRMPLGGQPQSSRQGPRSGGPQSHSSPQGGMPYSSPQGGMQYGSSPGAGAKAGGGLGGYANIPLQTQEVSRRPPARVSSMYVSERPSVWKALSPALALIALSVAFTFLDRAFAHSRGVPLSFGPVQASWIAGAVMVFALITGIRALLRVMDD